ncbi:MAG TPA: nuclear transport factor 2 family protein [Blastocatellia bacterium]|jgi:hypothetical protein|nr:nuclear transport factor 2 family protein [Blastocatellia bacterium]
MSQENINVINKIYETFGQRDFAAVLEHFAPTFEWIAAANSPLADHSPYRGLDEVRDVVFARIAAGFERLTVKVDEIFGADDKVVALGFYNGVRKASGKRFQAQLAHIWTLANGKAVKFQQYVDALVINMGYSSGGFQMSARPQSIVPLTRACPPSAEPFPARVSL